MIRKNQKKPISRIPVYNLKEVKRLVAQDQLYVTSRALQYAREYFRWTQPEIKRFLLGLRGSHFYKKMRAEDPSWRIEWLDVYRAEMYGKTVYTHFFIQDGALVIVNSFKPDESME